MRVVIAVLALLALSGCASVETFKITRESYAPVRQNEVLVYFDVSDLPPHESIGEITSEDFFAGGADRNAFIKKARKKAAELGANAILVREFRSGGMIGVPVATGGMLLMQEGLFSAAMLRVEGR